MRIAICDDEPESIQSLQECILVWGEQSDINISTDCFDSGAALLTYFENKKYDLIFLDVSMPSMDGFELAKRLRLIDADAFIIFVTFMAEFMPKAFHVMAADYIIKPVSQDKLSELLDRLKNNLDKNTDTYIIRLKGGGEVLLPLEKILFLESMKHYIRATTPDNEYEYLGKLDIEETVLSKKDFVRIHQSYLVNMAHVFIAFDTYVSLTDGTKLPISRKYSKNVRDVYASFRKRLQQ